MIALITGLLRGLWGYLAAAGLALVAFVAWTLHSQKAGALKEKAKQRIKVDRNVEKAKRVRRRRRADPHDRSRVRKFDRPKPK